MKKLFWICRNSTYAHIFFTTPKGCAQSFAELCRCLYFWHLTRVLSHVSVSSCSNEKIMSLILMIIYRVTWIRCEWHNIEHKIISLPWVVWYLISIKHCLKHFMMLISLLYHALAIYTWASRLFETTWMKKNTLKIRWFCFINVIKQRLMNKFNMLIMKEKELKLSTWTFFSARIINYAECMEIREEFIIKITKKKPAAQRRKAVINTWGYTEWVRRMC